MTVAVDEVRTLLARAFADDPLMTWFFPDDDARPHACAVMFGLFAERYLRHGRVDVVRRDRPVAVAMWRLPGAPEEPATLPTLNGLMPLLMGPGAAAERGAAMSVLAGLRPPEPYAYLHLLGVDPSLQGRGLGGEALAPGLAAARDAGLVACLETMTARNVPFYEAHGFVVRSEVRLAAGGPTVWAMATG